MIFDADQGGSNIDQHIGIDEITGLLQCLQPRHRNLHTSAMLAQSQHAQRIGHLGQQLHLRLQLARLNTAAQHKIFERDLDAAQILADSSSHGLHHLDRGRREVFTLLLNRFICRQHFTQAERSAYRRHTRTLTASARNVIEQVVEQLYWRALRVARLAFFVQAPQLAISHTHQAFDRYAGIKALLAKRFDHSTSHPPQLEHGLFGSHFLQLSRNAAEGFEILLDLIAANPTDQTHLEAGTQATSPMRHSLVFGNAAQCGRHGLPIRFEVQ